MIKFQGFTAMVVESYRQARGQRKCKESMKVLNWKVSKKNSGWQ